MRTALVDFSLYYDDPEIITIEFPDHESILGCDLVVIDLEEAFRNYKYKSERKQKNIPWFDDSLTATYLADCTRRHAELVEVIRGGGTIAVSVPPPLNAYIDTGGRTYSGTGRNRHTTVQLSNHDFLSVLPYKLTTQIGRGTNFSFANDGIGGLLRDLRNDLEYQAIIVSELSTIVATIAGIGTPVAGILKSKGASGGRIVLLPKLRTRSEYKTEKAWLSAGDRYLDAIIAVHERLTSSHEKAPSWLSDYRTNDELNFLLRLSDLNEKMLVLQNDVADVQSSLNKAADAKMLLYGHGRALEIAVAEALKNLGVAVSEGESSRTDLVLQWRDSIAVAEVKGLSKSAAESNAAQTEKWVSEYHSINGVEPKGILIVNPFRHQELSSRQERPFPEQMMKYVLRKELSLVTTQQLYLALEAYRSDPDRVDRFLDGLFGKSGLIEDFADWSEFLRRDDTGSNENIEDDSA